MIFKYQETLYRVRQADEGLIVDQAQQRQDKKCWVRMHPRLNYCDPSLPLRKPNSIIRAIMKRYRATFEQI